MTRSFVRLRARSLCFLLLSLSLFPLPSPPFSSILRVPHPIVIHTWPFVLARLLAKMNRARQTSERASKQPPFSFPLAYSVRVSCMCTHALAFSGFFLHFFSLSLSLFLRHRRRMHRRYSISSLQLSSSSSTWLYFYLLFTRE